MTPSISPKTKDRVILKANELAYKTNKFAVNLKQTDSPNTNWVIVPNSYPFYVHCFLAGIEKIANEAV